MIPLNEDVSLWDKLKDCGRPVVLYGMGDGADKILDVCTQRGITIDGVFASDGFVRGQVFRGFQVETLALVEQRFGEFVILLCFASSRPEVLAQIADIAARHELYAPDVPVCGGGLFTPEYVHEYADEIGTTYDLLADDLSRQVFCGLIDYKISGKLDYLHRRETPKTEAYTNILRLGNDESFVDAGAYNGDTVEEFLAETSGRYRYILALEPDARNFRKLEATVQRLGLHSAECRNVGVWNTGGVLAFDHKSGRQAALRDGGAPNTPVDSIDNLLAGRAATLIKFDVEGAEAQALAGSRATIAAHRPKLIVSAYHRNEDLFALPLLIHELRPDYRIYLRHHPYIPAWDTNLYVT